VTAKNDNLDGSFFYDFPQHVSVTLLVHTAGVGFVIRTAVSVPADMVSEDGNVISALLVTMVSLTVSVSVLRVCMSVCKHNQIITVCLKRQLVPGMPQ